VEELLFQLLNVHDVSDVRQIELHTAELLVPGPSRLEVEIAIAKLKKYIKAGSEILLSSIHKHIKSVLNKKELLEIYQFTKSVTKLIVIIIVGYYCYQLHTKFLSNILLSRLVPYIDEIIWDHQCGFRRNRSTTEEIFCIRQILEEGGNTTRQYISYS
jgi:hypothetical protein